MSIILNTLRRLLLVLLLLWSINLVYLIFFNSYDFWLGSIRVTANTVFKPLRWFNITLVLLAVLNSLGSRSPIKEEEEHSGSSTRFAAAILVVVFSLYLISFFINLNDPEWDHRETSAGINSFKDLLALFATPRSDGFYRPLTYFSLWLDFALFGNYLWAYHLQNVLLHAVKSILVYKLGVRLRLGETTSRLAALFFAVAAVNFEAVLWPAARFDLLAVSFTILALIYFIKYLEDNSSLNQNLYLFVGFFVMGVLNKESAYAFPLLAGLLLVAHSRFNIVPGGKLKYLFSMAPILLVSLVLIAIRVLVYDNLGGYRDPGGVSPHFQLSFHSVWPLMVNSALPLLALNTSLELPIYAKGALLGFIAASLLFAFENKLWLKRSVVPLLVVMVILSAIPTINVIGWIRPSLQHARYLYLPAVFVSLLVASLFNYQKRFARLVIVALLLVNALAAVHNLWVYREMLTRAERLSELVYREQRQAAMVKSIYLVGLPEAPNGVFYFTSELQQKIEAKLPDVDVRVIPPDGNLETQNGTSAVYYWREQSRTLVDRPPENEPGR